MKSSYINKSNSPKAWLLVIVFSFSPLFLIGSTKALTRLEIFIAAFFMFLILFTVIKMAMETKLLNIGYLGLPIILLLLYFCFDALKIYYTQMSFNDWMKWRKCFFILIYFPVFYLFRDHLRIKFFIFVIIVVGTLISSMDLYDIITRGSYWGGDILERNVKSSYPLWVAIFTLSLFRHILTNSSYTYKFKIFILICFIICGAASIAFARRTPFIIMLISLSISFFFAFHFDKIIEKKYLLMILSFIFLLYVSQFFLENRYNFIDVGVQNYTRRLQSEQIEKAFIGRSSRYLVAWDHFIEAPIFGTTKGEDLIYFYDPRYNEVRSGSVHSLYMYFIFHGGIVGFLLFIFLQFRIIRLSNYMLKKKIRQDLRIYAEASFNTIICIFIVGLFSTRVLSIESFLLIGSLMGIIASIHQLRLPVLAGKLAE